MMMEKKKEDEGPNGCLVCLEATWNGIVVSINNPFFNLSSFVGRVQCDQVYRDGHLQWIGLLLVPHEGALCHLLLELQQAAQPP